MSYYNETKTHSCQWKFSKEPRPTRAHEVQLNVKVDTGHNTLFIQQFLKKHSAQPLYFPDTTLCNFFLIIKHKKTLIEQHFLTAFQQVFFKLETALA